MYTSGGEVLMVKLFFSLSSQLLRYNRTVAENWDSKRHLLELSWHI